MSSICRAVLNPSLGCLTTSPKKCKSNTLYGKALESLIARYVLKEVRYLLEERVDNKADGDAAISFEDPAEVAQEQFPEVQIIQTLHETDGQSFVNDRCIGIFVFSQRVQ